MSVKKKRYTIVCPTCDHRKLSDYIFTKCAICNKPTEVIDHKKKADL